MIPQSPVTPPDPDEPPTDAELDEAAMEGEDRYIYWLQGGRDDVG